jgi:hypothetical protein
MDYKFQSLNMHINKDLFIARRLLHDFNVNPKVSKHQCLQLIKYFIDFPQAHDLICEVVDKFKLPKKRDDLLIRVNESKQVITNDDNIEITSDVEKIQREFDETCFNNILNALESTQLELKFAVELLNDLKKENANLKKK